MVTGWTKAASHDVELMRQSAGSTGAAGRPGPARRLLSSLRWMAGFRSLAAEWSSRSHSFTEFGVLPGFTGVAVHDRYSVYDNRAFAGVGGHQICCAHYAEPPIMPMARSSALVAGGGRARGFGIIRGLRGRRAVRRVVGSDRVAWWAGWCGPVPVA